jgi:hypothetical protein
MDEGALPLDHQHVQHPALVPTAYPTYAPAVNAVSDRNGRVAGIILFCSGTQKGVSGAALVAPSAYFPLPTPRGWGARSGAAANEAHIAPWDWKLNPSTASLFRSF